MASSKNKRDLMDANPKTGGGGDKLPKISDIFDLVKIGKDFKQLRILSGMVSFAVFWIPIKGTKSEKEVKIPRVSLNYNPETDSFDDNGCPYSAAGFKPQVKYLFNIIDRDEQEELGAKKTPKYSKDEIKAKALMAGTKSRSPVRVIQLPPVQVDKLKNLAKINKVKDKKKGNTAVSVNDDKYGIDLNISYNPDGKGGNQYDIQKSERTPLTDTELEYLLFDIEKINELYKPMSLEDAKEDMKNLKKILVKEKGAKEDYSEDDSKKSKKKSKKDESEESESTSELSDSEDDKKKSKKSKGKSKKEESESASESEESGSELGSDLSDSEEDKKKSKKKKGKKDDSDSESESEEKSNSSESEESESESEAPKKKAKGKKSKKEESESASESEEASSEEESEESEAPKKKSKKKK